MIPTISHRLTHICTPRPEPSPLHLGPIAESMNRAQMAVPALSVAALSSAFWTPGRLLRIAFHRGTKADRQAVLDAAAEWSKLANLKFEESTAPDAELRCSFDLTSGSWSYIGNQALAIPRNEATLNMGWPNDPARDLHEIGHAIGLVHEHENPLAHDGKGIPWNKPNCYAFFEGPRTTGIPRKSTSRFSKSTTNRYLPMVDTIHIQSCTTPFPKSCS